MLTWTPSKPIALASATASSLPVCFRFQSVTPTLNFAAAGAARSSRAGATAAAASAVAVRPRNARLLIVFVMACPFSSRRQHGLDVTGLVHPVEAVLPPV